MTTLQKAAHEYACRNHQWLKDALPTLAGQKSFEAGGKWQLEHLWHDAQGDYLPEIDREVIVLCDDGHGGYKVCFAHRPNKKGYLGKNLVTGNVETFYPHTYGKKGGWNIPDVRWWLDVDLPKEEEK